MSIRGPSILLLSMLVVLTNEVIQLFGRVIVERTNMLIKGLVDSIHMGFTRLTIQSIFLMRSQAPNTPHVNLMT
jgi:hypothetical protein